MDYEKLSKESLEQIMAAIREENGKASSRTAAARQGTAAGSGCGGDPRIQCDARLKDAQAFLDEAVIGTQIGLRKAPMYKKKGIARFFSRLIERIYLRVAELTNRDLRSFSSSVISAMRILTAKTEELENENRELAARVRSLEKTSPVSFDDVDGTVDFYHDFEERFRGKREEIVGRLEVYRPLLGEILGSFEGKRCIDLGCGRGEMLDFFRLSGIEDRVGVDLDPVQLEICRRNGHETEEMDCVAFLKKQSDASADVISAIQLVEHLPFVSLVALLDEARRVLKDGGVILLETPNCGNLITATSGFWLDPSHLRPLHPEYLRFMAERSGFGEVRIVEANPAEYAKKLEDVSGTDENIRQLNQLLYGAQDYALIGIKR